ncbi:rho GTPase-activating protein 6-like isoform X2 [Tasmannia lanceolata]|uniref:rho GTPase-activating protein 6-like isoform X2 n=1 Tax=Tasmannia lanceolata TaxID=3420 RepID=UPI004062F789
MVSRNAEASQGEGDMASTSSSPATTASAPTNGPAQFDQQRFRAGNNVFKSGPLFISSKGIGWTSWKKRWFILTRTSLVFFRSDPSALPQKGSEVNLTLGGIDLNNSGSVVVRADKKLLTVLFPDGRDGRAFTLKAETSEDMYEWKAALESALAQAPSAALVMGQNGIFRNDAAEAIEGSFEQWKDKRPVKSMVIGRPILLALEDVDGSPSFLEKALRFIEQCGIKAEGILRQSADVEEVERRVQEYEQGKTEFSPDEDAHVIADCVKHILRELPSSPVPASCCTSLLEAFRKDRGSRVNAMRTIVSETFPEPNRLLVQRILKMMQIVASHKSENLMSTSAVAACMAPLLLRPLLAGDCLVEDDFSMGGDGSIQLLQAAAAANHAQAIVITLLEEFHNIFLDGSFSPEIYSGSEDSGSEDNELTEDEILEDDGYHDAQHDLESDTEDDPERSLSGTLSESSGNEGSDIYDNKDFEGHDSDSESPKSNEDLDDNKQPSKGIHTPLSLHDSVPSKGNLRSQSDNYSSMSAIGSREVSGGVPASTSPKLKSTGLNQSSSNTKSTSTSKEPVPSVKCRTIWGRTSARKNLSMESIDISIEDDEAILKLELTKVDLQNKIAREAKGNATLQESLERRKQALHERRLILEKDVLRLQEQLQKERDLRATLEARLNMPLGHLPISSTMDSKTRVELEEIALAEADVITLNQKVADLNVQLSQQRQQNYSSVCESCNEHPHTSNHQCTQKAQQKDVETTATLCEKSNRSEHFPLRGDFETDTTQDPSSPNRQTAQNTTRSTGTTTYLSTDDPSIVGLAYSKKSSGKGEHPPDLKSQNNTKLRSATTQLSTEEPSIAEPDSSKKATAKAELPDLKIQNSTKSTETTTHLSAEEPSKFGPDSSKMFAGKAEQPDLKGQNSTKSTGATTHLSADGPSKVGPDSSKKFSGEAEKQPDLKIQNSTISTGSTTHLSVEVPSKVGPDSSKKFAGRAEDISSGPEFENVCVITRDTPSNKQSSQKQQPDPSKQDNTKSAGSSSSTKSAGSTSSLHMEESSTTGSAALTKSTGKGEGAGSTVSALTRLTNRLNFLKERRSQIVNDLQTVDTSNIPSSEAPLACPLPRNNSR